MPPFGRGVQLVRRAGAEIVPALRSGAAATSRALKRAASSPAAKPALRGVGIGTGVAAGGAGLGFAIDAVRKSFHAPATQSFPDVIAGGVDADAIREEAEANLDAAGAEREQRQLEVPTLEEFLTSPKGLLFLLAVAVLLVAVNRRGGR